MIKGPSDDDSVGAGAGGIPLGTVGASVGEGSTFVIEYGALEDMISLVAGAEDVTTVLNEATGVDTALLETGGVAYAEDDETDGATVCDEEIWVEINVVSTGTDEGDGKTVVYCVTMTTGGTCSDVEGKSSTEGDCTTEDCTEEVAGMAAAAELELGAEESGALGEDGTSGATGVGKTVVYSVLVTTRRVEVVIVELLDTETEELASVADDDTCVTDTRVAPIELAEELLGAAVP